MFQDLIDFEVILFKNSEQYRFKNATFKRAFGEWPQGHTAELLVFTNYPLAQIAELNQYGEIIRTQDFTLSPK